MIKRVLACMLSMVVTTTLFALDLELTQGVNAALPIGINSFGKDENARGLTAVISNDLAISGQFKLIKASFRGQPALSYWKRAGADSVLSGQITPMGHDRLQVSFELVDVASEGRTLLSNKYVIQESQLRTLAHHISDVVYQKLTGTRGVFSTKIAYIMVLREGGKARYSLEIADMDGFHPQSLLVSSEPIMSPSWSPNGKSIAYVTFEKKRSQIFTVDVASGKRRLITSFDGINGAPSWAPNGKELAMVLSKGGSPKIYLVSLASGMMKQLTFGNAIDTEPRFSPDGQNILFTSGRGGSPQIYRLDLASNRVSRVSFNGNYNARASYTPDQQSIVMLHRTDHDFNIGVQDLHSGQYLTLTDSSMDESPSVSPNGRLVLYATHDRYHGVLSIVSIDGHIKLKFPSRVGDIQEPAWSPFLG
ncbi:MAG: Tol-Pal system beta propeller repeat protein TolB [Gammaproteobacteria bacterium]|nr:Tol-Pal system beta propeller repeat protein TolB [Gammaproteobacteria bacterium]